MPNLASRGCLAVLAFVAVALSACGANITHLGAGHCVGPTQSFYVSSAAMVPTINNGQHVIVDRGAYRSAVPRRGDIVVFTPPPIVSTISASAGVRYLIKRIIGLPGESIASSPTGQILINSNTLAEPWLSSVIDQEPGPPVIALTIPPRTYYVMGDNRGNSEDSRFFGPIARSTIVGKVMLGGCG